MKASKEFAELGSLALRGPYFAGIVDVMKANPAAGEPWLRLLEEGLRFGTASEKNDVSVSDRPQIRQLNAVSESLKDDRLTLFGEHGARRISGGSSGIVALFEESKEKPPKLVDRNGGGHRPLVAGQGEIGKAPSGGAVDVETGFRLDSPGLKRLVPPRR